MQNNSFITSQKQQKTKQETSLWGKHYSRVVEHICKNAL